MTMVIPYRPTRPEYVPMQHTAADVAQMILDANDGAWPITTGQLERIARANAITIERVPTMPFAAGLHLDTGGGVILIPTRYRGRRRLRAILHELAELLTDDADPAYSHQVAAAIDAEYACWLDAVPLMDASRQYSAWNIAPTY